MKKLFLAAFLAVAGLSQAQVQFGIRANALFNTSSSKWKDISQSAKGAVNDPKDATGYNVGLSLKIDLPMTSFFVMPEIYYTHFKSDVSYTTPAQNGTGMPVAPEQVGVKAITNRIDVPVLLGYNIIRPFGIFIGPVFSSNISGDKTFADLREEGKKNFSMGYQFGANLKISKLVLNARYEGALSKDQRKFVNNVTGDGVNYDSRPSFVLLGLGYNF